MIELDVAARRLHPWRENIAGYTDAGTALDSLIVVVCNLA
jgi:hypothetical protein